MSPVSITIRNSIRRIATFVAFWTITVYHANSQIATGPSIGVPILPDEVRANLHSNQFGTSETYNEFEFYLLDYRSSTIDLRSLKFQAGYNIPSSVDIIPPNLEDFDHTVVLIGLTGTPMNPKMIIWLAGNYRKNTITFFVDQDQDRNFNNDLKPIRMSRGKPPVEIMITPKKGSPSTLWLTAPAERVQSNAKHPAVYHRFVLGAHIGAGSGDLIYKAEDDIRPGNTYEVNTTEKSFGLSFLRYTSYFIYGVRATFQNHYNYASYNSGAPSNQGVNRDIHPRNKVQFGFEGAGRVILGRRVEFHPVFRTGLTQYIKPTYKPNRYRDESYRLGLSPYFEYGARLEFVIGRNQLFNVTWSTNRQEWKPKGFPGTSGDRALSRLRITQFSLGYRRAF